MINEEVAIAMVSHIIDEFRNKENIEYIIGFSGSSDESSKEEAERIIEDSMLYFKNKDIAILTGGTKFGIVKTANEIAKDYGLKTIGVLPDSGEKYSLPYLDCKVTVPSDYGRSEFGDESATFVKALDAMEIIGGNAGTAIEFFHAMKINERKIKPKYNEQPIVIAPLKSIEGFGQMAYGIPQARMMPEAFPQEPIMYGGDAAKFILHKLRC
ncbi:MAG: hypothetical protein R6V53_06625 [Candidatus Woesearchaeota archaeon]